MVWTCSLDGEIKDVYNFLAGKLLEGGNWNNQNGDENTALKMDHTETRCDDVHTFEVAQDWRQ